MYIKENQKKEAKNISYVLFMYWLVVILWQTFRPVANRSLVDTAVKMGVFLAVVLYAYSNRSEKFSSVFTGTFLFFIATQFCTFYVDRGNITTGNLITVVFMLMQIFVFFGWCRNARIEIFNLEWFCIQLNRIVLIMCLYNMIFNWNRFSIVFSLNSGAYGYECRSFLYSNHEFALYTAAAIISLTWLLISEKIKFGKASVLYIIFILNILSTYSRTALLGCGGAILVLLLFYSKKIFAWIAGIGALLYSIVLSNDYLYTLVFVKILKGSFIGGEIDDGRDSMYEMEWDAFVNADILQKIFGHGYGGASQFPGHDAYLVILLTGGIIMFLWFAFVIFLGIYSSLKIMKNNKSVGSLMLGFQILSLLYMVAQTPILFYSTMDSFFITSIAVLIPYYVANGYLDPPKIEERKI